MVEEEEEGGMVGTMEEEEEEEEEEGLAKAAARRAYSKYIYITKKEGRKRRGRIKRTLSHRSSLTHRHAHIHTQKGKEEKRYATKKAKHTIKTED